MARPRQWRQRWLPPLSTDMTPVWDFPQLAPTAPDMAEDCRRSICRRTIRSSLPAAPAHGKSGRLVCQFVHISAQFGCRPVPHHLSRICEDGRAAPGVCPARSERSSHGQLLTHGILQRLKFKQDLSGPWHTQYSLLCLSHTSLWSHAEPQQLPGRPETDKWLFC